MKKTYKAFVTDRQTGRRFFIEVEDTSKKQVMEDIRGNGYSCSRCYCKEKEIFDWVSEESSYYGDSASHYAIWQFNKIPESDQEYQELMDKYRDQYLTRKIRNKVRYESKKRERR